MQEEKIKITDLITNKEDLDALSLAFDKVQKLSLAFDLLNEEYRVDKEK